MKPYTRISSLAASRRRTANETEMDEEVWE